MTSGWISSRDIMSGGKGNLAGIEAAEREKTGIPKLKVGYNRVFGYYIEISKTYQGQVPENYIRKQTLANCERYITQELKELEATILGAKDRITALEYEIFTKLRNYVSENSARVQLSCQVVAEADVLCALAEAATDNGYVRPEVDFTDEIHITEGRHPSGGENAEGHSVCPQRYGAWNRSEPGVSDYRTQYGR